MSRPGLKCEKTWDGSLSCPSFVLPWSSSAIFRREYPLEALKTITSTHFQLKTRDGN